MARFCLSAYQSTLSVNRKIIKKGRQEMDESVNALILQGIKALEQGNTLVALVHFETAVKNDSSPILLANYGYCLAVERNEYRKGLGMCMRATEANPTDNRLWLLFGRTCLLAGQKSAAMKAFRRGLKVGRNPAITAELKRLGRRKSPVIEALDRGHLVNRQLGRCFNWLGLR
jgi:tetratricopeptide (TPR) repeat protein